MWVTYSTALVIYLGMLLLKEPWPLWLLYCLLGYGIVSTVAAVVRRGVETKNPMALWIDAHAPGVVRLAGMKMSERTVLRAFIFILLPILGWLASDSWSYHHTFVLYNVDVIAKEGARTFWLQRRDLPIGQVFPWTICKDPKEYVPDLQPYDHIDVVVYAVPLGKSPVGCFTINDGPLGIVYTRPRKENAYVKWK